MWKNAWINIDLTAYTPAQINAFFSIQKDSPEYNALSRRRQLILLAYWQAKPDRLYRSKLNNRKWLVYVHFPESLADELRALDGMLDSIAYAGASRKDLSTAIHEEYFTGAGNGRVILDPNEVGYDPNKNYPFYNVLWGVAD